MATKSAGTSAPAASKQQCAMFEKLIGGLSPHVQDMARAGRRLVQTVMPDVVETVWLDQGTASYGVGPKKMSEHFVYFTFAKTHLGFGFYYGADLKDPSGLLEGTGKSMRHVKITSVEDLARPAFKALVLAASKHLPKLG
jgi:hypothetical protein